MSNLNVLQLSPNGDRHMPQREQKPLEPFPRFSRVFNITPGDYDKPGAALRLLEVHLGHLATLEECQWLVARGLADPKTRARLDAESLLDPHFADINDALLSHALHYAISELAIRIPQRIQNALRLDEQELPSPMEHKWTIDLLGARPDASWTDLGREYATYEGTRWILNDAAFPKEGAVLTIRQATSMMAESASTVPDPEAREIYMRWGHVLLDQM